MYRIIAFSSHPRSSRHVHMYIFYKCRRHKNTTCWYAHDQTCTTWAVKIINFHPVHNQYTHACTTCLSMPNVNVEYVITWSAWYGKLALQRPDSVLHSLPVRPSNFTNSVTVPYTARYTTFSYMHKTRGHFDSSHFQNIIKSQATTRCTNMSGGLAVYILPERATGHLSLVLHST